MVGRETDVTPEAKKTPTATSDAVIKEALERFDDSQEGTVDSRDTFENDIRFSRLGDQWPEDIRKLRQQEARPYLTINKLPALIRAVANESRQNKPGIKVSPVDNGADEDTAEVIGGLVRSIERNSNAPVAYNTAIDQALSGGFGFFRVAIDYAHDESFDLEAQIVRVPNSLMVHWDIMSTEFTSADWMYAFISDILDKKEYVRRWPEASMVPFDTGTQSYNIRYWNDERGVRVAEYFLREPMTRVLIQFAFVDPETNQTVIKAIREDDLPDMARQYFEAGGITPNGGSDDELAQQFIQATQMDERRRRDVEYHKVMRRIINGVEVLDEEEWPGSTIPICPVWGDEVYDDGRRRFRSMIADARDPQMMHNFWRSATTELVALAPKTPWVGAKGFVPKDMEEEWQHANERSYSYLEYEVVQGAPPPQRQPFAGIPTGALQEATTANEDMQAVTGIYPSSIGARSNETSGVAIQTRERQGDVSNYHFIDNLSRAIQGCGKILVEIIPAVYSTRETIRILGEDQKEKVINLTQEAGGAFRKGIQGQPALYNLSVGKYDVEVKTGPSFQTQREETRETLMEIGKAVPAAMPIIADLLADLMDFQGADKLAKRLNSLLPPEIRAQEDEEGAEDNPEAAEARQALKAQGQQFQQIQQEIMGELQQFKAENDALKADKTVETQKAQADAAAKSKELDIKGRELGLKEAEAAAHARQEVPPDQQAKYDRAIEQDKQAHEAAENERDRQVDLAKTIINKAEEDDAPEVMEAAGEKAMAEALRILGSPRRIVRGAGGEIIGTEVIEGPIQ